MRSGRLYSDYGVPVDEPVVSRSGFNVRLSMEVLAERAEPDVYGDELLLGNALDETGENNVANDGLEFQARLRLAEQAVFEQYGRLDGIEGSHVAAQGQGASHGEAHLPDPKYGAAATGTPVVASHACLCKSAATSSTWPSSCSACAPHRPARPASTEPLLKSSSRRRRERRRGAMSEGAADADRDGDSSAASHYSKGGHRRATNRKSTLRQRELRRGLGADTREDLTKSAKKHSEKKCIAKRRLQAWAATSQASLSCEADLKKFATGPCWTGKHSKAANAKRPQCSPLELHVQFGMHFIEWSGA
jgi:hypothetical protein